MESILTKAISSAQQSKIAFSKYITANDTGATGGHQAGFHIHKHSWQLFFEKPGEKGENKDKFIITRGNNRIGISAACMFFACQKKGMIYTPKEIAEFYEIKYAEINKGIKKLRTLINIQLIVPTNVTGELNKFIRHFCDNLKIMNIHTDDIFLLPRVYMRQLTNIDYDPFRYLIFQYYLLPL